VPRRWSRGSVFTTASGRKRHGEGGQDHGSDSSAQGSTSRRIRFWPPWPPATRQSRAIISAERPSTGCMRRKDGRC
jgi:hypothetical protein